MNDKICLYNKAFQMITINISINEDLAKIVDHEVKDKKYANRSEFFRDLIRQKYVYKKKLPVDIDYYKALDKTLDFWKDKADNDIFLTN